MLFALWVLIDLGTLLLPFALGFFIAYLLDPLVTRAERWRIPRWVSALLLNALLIGLITLVAIFVAPIVWEQFQELAKGISSLVNASQQFLESRQFYRWLRSLGIPSEQVRSLVQDVFVPRLENISQYLFSLVVNFLEGAASILAQLVNIILVPLLAFYLLVDMPRLKALVRQLLAQRSPKILSDLIEINRIVRAYITGQLITATVVGVLGVVGFVLAGIPYGVFLGVLCGLLNPIPYVGLLASLLIAVVTIILASSPTPILDIILATAIINLLHFIGAYIIDPRITGKRVGLHPVLLIAALFVFGHFFGLLGLIAAVPITAVLMMYFNRWASTLEQQSVEQPTSNDVA
jgi:predicted PurR-regulated permease PerM